jgi:hypothetical protein
VIALQSDRLLAEQVATQNDIHDSFSSSQLPTFIHRFAITVKPLWNSENWAEAPVLGRSPE